MTRTERTVAAEIIKKFPQVDEESAVHWYYSRNQHFENLSPASFRDKFGSKRFLKTLKKLVDFD